MSSNWCQQNVKFGYGIVKFDSFFNQTQTVWFGTKAQHFILTGCILHIVYSMFWVVTVKTVTQTNLLVTALKPSSIAPALWSSHVKEASSQRKKNAAEY